MKLICLEYNVLELEGIEAAVDYYKHIHTKSIVSGSAVMFFFSVHGYSCQEKYGTFKGLDMALA